jgi:hypothetical protein
LNLDAEWACAAMGAHRASLKNAPKTVEEYLATLKDQGLSRVSQAVRPYAAEPPLRSGKRVIHHVIAAPAAVSSQMGFHGVAHGRWNHLGR